MLLSQETSLCDCGWLKPLTGNTGQREFKFLHLLMHQNTKYKELGKKIIWTSLSFLEDVSGLIREASSVVIGGESQCSHFEQRRRMV